MRNSKFITPRPLKIIKRFLITHYTHALSYRPVVEESGNEQGVRRVRKLLLKVWRYLVPYDKRKIM